MLRFYFTRHELPTLRTPYSSPFKLESAAPYINKPLPMSHLYVTSNHYVDYIYVALGEEHKSKLEELGSEHRTKLIKHPRFPLDLKNKQFKTVSELHAMITSRVGDAREINIVIINGIGNGLGDNYIGLGILQRFTKLLAPINVNFHLMQELDQRIAPVYAHQANVTMHCNVMSVEKFMSMDFYIDFDGIDNMPHFDHVPAAHFTAHAFSINQLIPKINLQAILRIDQEKAQGMRQIIAERLDPRRATVLLHPLASTPLRTLPNNKSANIVKELIAEGFNVVTVFAHNNPPEGFADLSEHCNSIDDLLHIVNAVDGVISVGTVVYHLASALSKPTVLLPTVKADVRSAELLPEVKTWLAINSEGFIQNLHKSDDPKHLEIANNIWRNLHPIDLAKATKQHLESFITKKSGETLAPKAPKRVAVIVLNAGNVAQLTSCLDALTNVNGFDPIRLYTKQLEKGLNVDLFQELQQAMTDGCDFIWALNSATEVASNYLTTALEQFQQDPDLELIGDSVFKGDGVTSSGGVSNLYPVVIDSLETFSLVIVRTTRVGDLQDFKPSSR